MCTFSGDTVSTNDFEIVAILSFAEVPSLLLASMIITMHKHSCQNGCPRCYFSEKLCEMGEIYTEMYVTE
jgi:hypothetical protein